MNITAIDFETATGKRYSACAVGITTLPNGIVLYFAWIRGDEKYLEI